MITKDPDLPHRRADRPNLCGGQGAKDQSSGCQECHMTSHPELRSGATYWRESGASPLRCPRLHDSVRCEVAIVGAGITGALIGYRLSRTGVDTVLLDPQKR